MDFLTQALTAWTELSGIVLLIFLTIVYFYAHRR